MGMKHVTQYRNFWEAYLDNNLEACRIGHALETALNSLHEQGLVECSTIVWNDMCSTAWASHIKNYYFGKKNS